MLSSFKRFALHSHCSVALTFWRNVSIYAGGAECTKCPKESNTWILGYNENSASFLEWHGSKGNSNLTACKCNRGYTGPGGEACQPCPVGTYKGNPGKCKAMVICNLPLSTVLINSTRRLNTSAYCRQSNVYRLSRKFYNHLDSGNWG